MKLTPDVPIFLPPSLRGQIQAAMQQVLARDHAGAANGITAARLAEKLGTNERGVRHLVSQAREDGIAVVGTPSTGYYIAETSDELEACCRFLRSRAMHSLHIEAQLRRTTLADLMGQMRLQT